MIKNKINGIYYLKKVCGEELYDLLKGECKQLFFNIQIFIFNYYFFSFGFLRMRKLFVCFCVLIKVDDFNLAIQKFTGLVVFQLICFLGIDLVVEIIVVFKVITINF